MSSFPYWPALITDPRHLPPQLQANAAKDLETKYLVYYYSTKNLCVLCVRLWLVERGHWLLMDCY